MLALVLLFCAGEALAGYDAIKPSGKLTISPSVVNLDSDVTFYTVSCQLDAVQDGLDSRSLYIELSGERIKSEILNESTVMAVEPVYAEKRQACGMRKYFCFCNGSGLDVGKMIVGFEPAEIVPESLKCVSEDLRNLRCEMPISRPCDLETSYKLSMNYRFGSSLCSIDVVGNRLIYDSSKENQKCSYRNGVELLNFDLEVRNGIGSRVMSFVLNNYDIVRPDKVRQLRVVEITSSEVAVRWIENVSLDHLHRNFQYQFRLISEQRNNSFLEEIPSMLPRYRLENLFPYTNYTLNVRLRLVPKLPRVFDEEYWSQWSSVIFRTLACKPDQPPKIVPGAFSLRSQTSDQATIDVYWQPIPTHLQNGPGFAYNVSAISDTGQRFYPAQSSSKSPVATFHNMRIGHYRILVSCFNDEGSTAEHDELEVFPTKINQQPIIKRVLNKGFFEVSWYPPTAQEDLTNYTVMYCSFTSSNVCQDDSIQFTILPPETTKFRTSSSSVLNFAVSANFKTHSTALTWQECIVSPSDVRAGSPRFEVINLKETSFDIMLQNTCMERSSYELLKVHVVQNKDIVFDADFDSGKDRLAVRGLKPGKEYVVQVIAYDELGMVQETRKVVTQEANGDALLSVTLYLSFAIVMVCMILVTAARMIQKVQNIKVEIPRQLTTEKSSLN